MIKSLFFMSFLFLLIFSSCQKEEVKEKRILPVSSASESKTVPKAGNDFSDLAKKEGDEACDTEEDLKKKMEEDIKKAQQGQALKLQGADTGCEVE
jgi:hypothetical protein